MSRTVRLLLAGSEAGTAGAIVMLCWLAFASAFYRHTTWWVPNLMASTFFGEAANADRFTRYTWSGLALLIAQYIALGMVYGVLLRQSESRLRATVFGLLLGAGYYYLMFHGVWRVFSPMMLLYSPDRPLLAGHLLYGLMLGRLPLFYRNVA